MTATVVGRPVVAQSPPPARRGVPWLAVVAAVYAVVQLAMVVPHMGGGLLWDESVYASQVDPHRPAAFFSAPRSRGISYLVAPVVAATSSVVALRVVLALLSAVALYAVFRVWGPLVGRGTAALAALLFSGLWITQISGSQVMPNLWVALGAVAAVGWFLRAPAEPHARWWLAAAVAGVTLLRMPDGGWLGLPLLAAAVCVRRWRPALPALLGGLALGAAPWVAEAYARFGGVGARLRASSATEGGMVPQLNVGTALRSLNGPLLCRPCQVPLRHPELTLWWLALPLLAAAALAVAVRDHRAGRGRALSATVLPVVCAASMAVPYLLLIDYSAPRFLLPAYALLALSLAALAARAVRAARSPVPVAAALGLVLAVQLGSQYAVLADTTHQAAATAERYQRAAAGLRALGLRPPCLVAGSRALPIGYAAGCASAEVSGNNTSTTAAALLRRAAHEPTAVFGHAPGHGLPSLRARGWTRHTLPGTGGLSVYMAPVSGRAERPAQR
ncbi:ArnT family glycosyltransferase [Streptomyces sp. NPDC000941]